MKKITLILILCAVGVMNAQKNKLIKTNPLGAIFKIYSLGYEQETKDNQSFTINALYSDFSLAGFKIKGPGIGVGYRFYFQNKDLFEGWFAGPSIAYSKLAFGLGVSDDGYTTSGELSINGAKIDLSESVGDLTANSFGISGIVGYQWNWQPITLELFLGIGSTSVTAKDEGSFSESSTGFGLNAYGFSMGYQF